MNLQRFVGANVREALQCVRTTLGADAMILSNRPAAEGGVEIVAMPHPAPSGEVPMSSGTGTPAGSRLAGARDGSGSAAAVPPMLPTGAADRPIPDGAPAAAMVATATRATTPDAFRMPAARGIDTAPRSAGGARSAFLAANRPRSGAHDGADEARPIAAAPARPAGETRGRVWGRRLSLAERAALGERVDPVYHEPPVPAKPAPADGESLRVEAIAAELASLKSLVERGFATLATPERKRTPPARTRLFSRLVDAGFGIATARRLSETLPDTLAEQQLLAWAQAAVRDALACANAADDIVARGGIYALVGPTGVGKTTTTAKLAARAALAHGAQRIALITTDGYRVAAREQLRGFGRILGVDVHWIQDRADLGQALAALRDRHLVLVDTIGASQRDHRVTEQLAMLSGHRVERLLLLNASAQRETLDEVIGVYARLGVAGAIVTKVDEAARVGGTVDVLMRHRLPVHYVTHGQRVPEDIVHASAAQLASLALPSESWQARTGEGAGDAGGHLPPADALRVSREALHA